MADTVQIEKGWLETREGNKYAPATLIENVFTRSGKKYDERVREYIASVQSGSNATIASLQTKVEEHATSIKDLQEQGDLLDAEVDDINRQLTAIGVDDYTDTFFIIDKNNKVIAYVNSTGVHSVEFETKSGVKLSQIPASITALIVRIEDIEADIKSLQSFEETLDNIQDDGGDKLYITDNAGNVLAYFDGDGLHSINVLTGGSTEHPQQYDLNVTLSELIGGIAANSVRLDAIENMIGGAEDGTRLYIMDEGKNVIAYFDANGLTVVNTIIKTNSNQKDLINDGLYMKYQDSISISDWTVI